MTARHLVIVNPQAGAGAAGRSWPQIEESLSSTLPAFEAVHTAGPNDATRLAREAIGLYEVVVAVGGDGTVSEVVNGLIGEDGRVTPGVALGVIPRGTGSDLVRSLGIPSALEGATAVLAGGRCCEIDVGRVRLAGADGENSTRYFINEAEVGIGAAVADAVNRASRRPGGAAAFWWAIVRAALRYKTTPVSFSVDGCSQQRLLLLNAWVANGRYSGAGLNSAPQASPRDGLLDLVRVRHAGIVRRLTSLRKLRTGAFIDLPEVDYQQTRGVEATAEAAVPIETDGEVVGATPARFDLLDSRLPVICALDQ